MDAMCKGEQFVVILLLLSCCGTSMSSIPRELSLFVYVVCLCSLVAFVLSTSPVRKGERSFSFLCLCGDASFCCRIGLTDLFSAAPVTLI